MTVTRNRSVGVGVSAALLLVLAGCDGGLMGVDTGNVRFVLMGEAPAATLETAPQTDMPHASLEPARSGEHEHDRDERPWRAFVSANVTFTSILARNFDGVLVDTSMELPATVDIMRVDGGREIVLPDGELPPGTYDQVVVVMTAFQGELRDGTRITIEPPGGGWTAVIPVCPFDVEDGGTAIVGLTLSLQKSLFRRDNRFGFQPHFECGTDTDSDEEPSGA